MASETPNLDNLMAAEDVDAMRRARGFQKGPSKLQIAKAEEKLTVVDEQTFRATVRKRDKLRCRKCGRKVVVQLKKAPKRAEVHHLYGRAGDFKFDDRFALLACCECHEKLTGKVNEKWIPVGTKFIEIKGQPRIDARAKVSFTRVA